MIGCGVIVLEGELEDRHRRRRWLSVTATGLLSQMSVMGEVAMFHRNHGDRAKGGGGIPSGGSIGEDDQATRITSLMLPPR